MNVLIISDITLEALNRKQLKHSRNKYSFIFCEDLVYELDVLNGLPNFDIVYIHFDCYFKRYRRNYVSLILESILSLSNKTQKIIAISNIFFGDWKENSLIGSVGITYNGFKEFEEQIDNLIKKQNIYFFDIANLIQEIGLSQSYNFSLGHLYQLPYTKVFLESFASYLDQIVIKLSSPDKKVIILDCDNTLWKGIIGEDGVDGVLCDLNSDGIIFYHLQQFLKSRKEIGFILCLCSKNNEDDVKEVFFKKRMPLKWEDFVIKKINWNNKDINIKEIAKELSLGLDSFIFIDDSEFEINIIKDSLSEVSVFNMTTDYQYFINISKDPIFSKKSITHEDLVKTEQYIIEAERIALEQRSTNFNDYIKSLDIIMKVEENMESDLLRVSQLTEKTNQFNFNKKYYSVEELREKILDGLFYCFTLRVSDRFGDYGLVGVILVEINSDNLILENYILSCRILGRKIEFDFFDYVQNRVKDIYSGKIEKIKFNKTTKNIPAQNFYNQIIQAL